MYSFLRVGNQKRFQKGYSTTARAPLNFFETLIELFDMRGLCLSIRRQHGSLRHHLGFLQTSNSNPPLPYTSFINRSPQKTLWHTRLFEMTPPWVSSRGKRRRAWAWMLARSSHRSPSCDKVREGCAMYFKFEPRLHLRKPRNRPRQRGSQ